MATERYLVAVNNIEVLF